MTFDSNFRKLMNTNSYDKKLNKGMHFISNLSLVEDSVNRLSIFRSCQLQAINFYIIIRYCQDITIDSCQIQGLHHEKCRGVR